MRPAGEIRQALRDCFPAAGQGMVTWRHALERLGQLGLVNPAAPGERQLVRKTVENMAAAGEIARTQPVRMEGSRRPLMAYARSGWATNWGQASSGAALAQVVSGWRV